MAATLDWSDFFSDSDSYTGPALTEQMIRAAESQLGYTLPPIYLQLLLVKNGGSPKRRCFATGKPGWADDHVEVTNILGIGGAWGIDSPQRGSQFMIREWNYPDVGIYIAHTPSAGHDGIMLDYRACGPAGEPRVLHVDVEGDERIEQILAPDISTFLLGLVDCAPFHARMDAGE